MESSYTSTVIWSISLIGIPFIILWFICKNYPQLKDKFSLQSNKLIPQTKVPDPKYSSIDENGKEKKPQALHKVGKAFSKAAKATKETTKKLTQQTKSSLMAKKGQKATRAAMKEYVDRDHLLLDEDKQMIFGQDDIEMQETSGSPNRKRVNQNKRFKGLNDFNEDEEEMGDISMDSTQNMGSGYDTLLDPDDEKENRLLKLKQMQDQPPGQQQPFKWGPEPQKTQTDKNILNELINVNQEQSVIDEMNQFLCSDASDEESDDIDDVQGSLIKFSN